MLSAISMSLWSISLVVVVIVATVVVAVKLRLPEDALPGSAKAPSEMYIGLRNQMLGFTAQQAGVQVRAGEPLVYGVLMDLSLPSGTATIVSLSTGDTSMYTSTGGGIIGGIGHESCRIASKQFIETAQANLGKLTRTAVFPLPPVGVFRFYVLTTEGVYTAEEREGVITSPRSPLHGLFITGNNVITQLRLTAPKE